MLDTTDVLAGALTDDARGWLETARAELAAGSADLRVLFPQLPRRTGREHAPAEVRRDGDCEVDFGAWRTCDAAAFALLAAAGAGDELLVDLYEHGDMEERTMVLRCLAGLPIRGGTLHLLGEIQRTNNGVHFEAGALDSNLVARALADSDPEVGFTRDDFNRMMLKLAFLDLPLARTLGAAAHANPELSRMLQDLATEREAATRKVWHDTNRLIARAPTAGTVARILGGLEHGDDQHRLAAVEGLAALNRPDLAAFARDRREREPRPEIRAALERVPGVS